MASRIYVVTNKAEKTESSRLIRAANQSQVLRHVAEEKFAAQVATQEQLVFLIGAGTKVEEVSAKSWATDKD